MTSKTQQVITHIQDNIHWQIYKKGERIPAVRELAKTLNVSAYTVSQAYDKLVAQGIIYAKQGSGYYVSSPTQQVLAKVDVPVLNQNVLDTGWLLQHLFNNWFLSLDLPRLAAAAILVALVLLAGILALLKWWDHCAKEE